jgi:hypothetical protein
MSDAERLAQPLFKREFLILNIVFPLYGLISENPPPCNEYYLMQTCSKEVRRRIWNTRKSRSRAINQGRCRYSHEYDLTDEQLAALANSAKQSPCWFSNNGPLLSFIE